MKFFFGSTIVSNSILVQNAQYSFQNAIKQHEIRNKHVIEDTCCWVLKMADIRDIDRNNLQTQFEISTAVKNKNNDKNSLATVV